MFPIVLVQYDPVWREWFREERAVLQRLFPDAAITHIGSTAVPGIMAKPVVDILIEFPSVAEMKLAASVMEGAGYIHMSCSPSRISMNKGYTEKGYAERVFHLHLRLRGDNAEISFRDYLRAHPEAAQEYENLKKDLADRFKHNRDAYTEGKTEFIIRCSTTAP